jgi:hypothetical protein
MGYNTDFNIALMGEKWSKMQKIMALFPRVHDRYLPVSTRWVLLNSLLSANLSSISTNEFI